MNNTSIKPKLILIVLSVLGLGLILGQSYFWSKSNKPNLAFAEAEEYIVKSGHPRIFLTDEVLATLNQKVASNAQEWQQLKAEADDYSNDRVEPPTGETSGNEIIGRGYQGSGYFIAVQSLGLAYQLTGNIAYANKVIEVMQIMADNVGIDIIKGDSGYGIRYYGPTMALGYDWCYDQLTATQKTSYYGALNLWLDWYSTSGYERTGPALGNYFSGYLLALGLGSYATYGENPKAQEYIDKARNLFENLIRVAADSREMRGGDDPEGEYAAGYYQRIFYYLLVVKSSTGEDIIGDGLNWPKEVVYSHIHRIKPQMDKQYDGGDWTTPGQVNATPMLILSDIFKGTKEGRYAKYYANHVRGASAFDKMLFYDGDSPEEMWNNEPLSYFSIASSLVTMRSDWSKDAIWASFQGGTDLLVGHQDYDKGHFSIQRGDDYLVVDTEGIPGYVGDTGHQYNTNHNSMLVDDKGEVLTYPPFQSPWGYPNQVEAFEDSNDYVYMKSNVTSAYITAPWQPPVKNPFSNFHRLFVYIRPDYFVVFDRVSMVKDYYTPIWALHPAPVPTISGDTVSAIVGDSKIFSKTLLPESFVIEYVKDYGHRVDIKPQQPSLDNLFLHVLYPTDSITPAMPDTIRLEADTGNMTGSYIQPQTGNYQLVLFSKTEQNQTQVTYTLPETQAQIKHLIADLSPDYTYNIYQDGNLLESQYVSSDGTLYFTSQGGGSFQINQGAYNPPPTITLFNAEPTKVETGKTVNFQAQAEDENGIKSYTWNFGDGKTSTEQNPSHKFTTVGSFTTKLTVTDTLDAFSTKEIIITVTPGPPNDPPVVTIIANLTEGDAPLKVNFTATAVDSDNDAIQSWYWTFGNGQTSTEQNPIYTYNQVGTFTVQAEATDARGATGTKQITIKVNEKKGIEDCSIGTRQSHYNGLYVENWYYYERGLLRFDLSEYSGQEISSAILSLYIASYPGVLKGSDGKIEISIHKVTQAAWDDNKADLNTYDGVNKWKTPGGDFDPTPVSTYNINAAKAFQDLWVTFDVTSLIQEYINQGTEPNPGMLLKASPKLEPALIFNDSASLDVSLRPKLEIMIKTTPKPNITITKSALVNGQPADQAKTGDIITYTITYKNTGEGEARNVIITDPIPDGTTYVAGSADATSGSFDGNQIIWNIGLVAAGGGGSVEMKVKVE